MTQLVSPPNFISVAIAHPHTMVRQALKKAFLYQGKIRITAEASCYAELIEMLPIFNTKILILEMNLQDLDSTRNTIRKIRKVLPEAKILMLTLHEDIGLKKEFTKLGIHSFIFKGAEFDVLEQSIINAAESVNSKSSKNGDFDQKKNVNNCNSYPAIFTSRERAILKLIVRGKTNSEISKLVFLSVSSIEQIRHTMKVKAHVSNTASLIDFAFRNQVID